VTASEREGFGTADGVYGKQAHEQMQIVIVMMMLRLTVPTVVAIRLKFHSFQNALMMMTRLKKTTASTSVRMVKI